MIEYQSRASDRSGVFRYLRPLVRLNIVNVKVTLQILRRSVLRVEIPAEGEQLASLRIEAHFVTRARTRSALFRIAKILARNYVAGQFLSFYTLNF